MSVVEEPEEDTLLRVAEVEIANLRLGLEHRSVTSAAVGILMERYGLDYATALATLRRVSNNRNVRLFDLAVDLLDSGDLDGLPHPSRPPERRGPRVPPT